MDTNTKRILGEITSTLKACLVLLDSLEIGDRLSRLDTIQTQTTQTPEVPKVKGKPGRKPGSKNKPKVALDAVPAWPHQITSKASEKRPLTMLESMVSVMGDQTLSAGEIEEALNTAKLPPKSNNPRAYISSVLSGAKDKNGVKLFESVGHGRHRVVNTATTRALRKSLNTAEAPAQTAEQILSEVGLSVPERRPTNNVQTAPLS